MKVFAGDYILKYSYVGINTYHLGKRITITEEGNPLDCRLYWYFAIMDSVKVQMLVRNRISRPLHYMLQYHRAIKLEVINSYDEVVKNTWLQPIFQVINLAPKSDQALFTFSRAKSDAFFNSLPVDTYKLRMTFYTLQGSFSAATYVSLTIWK